MSDQPFRRPARVRELMRLPPLADLLRRLQANAVGHQPFVLETGLGVGPSGRWHVLGAFPVGEARVNGCHWRTTVGSRERSGESDPWGGLESWWRTWGDIASELEYEDGDASRPEPMVEELRRAFLGGAVGYLGYELGEHLEAIERRAEPTPSPPDALFYLYDELVLIDRVSGRSFFVHRGRAQIEGRQWWSSAAPHDAAAPSEPPASLAVETVSLSVNDYLQLVEEVRERIADGDVYEMNLCRRHALIGAPSPWELHRRLRKWQPVPYAAFLPWDPVAVISASPECYLRRRGTEVLTRPIKGTAPRSSDRQENEARARALLASDKQRAELAMIIDLERNDLGRVCVPGSVEVIEEAVVEEYSTVLHTVATIRGRLPPDRSPWPLLRATFPGGSITGAPKIAAMKVIRRLEPVSRKIYTGSIGWIAPDGDLDLNIAIRTLFQHAGTTYYSVGSAITWDSDPHDELRELDAKGAALRRALLGAPE